MKKLFILFLGVLFLSGCSNDNDNGLISYMDAKTKVINEGAVIVDVRTEDEYSEKHIDGAVLLTLDTISEDTVNNLVDNKDTPIIVYCQSGNRSNQALTKLKDLGYSEVYDLGSINNWKE